jgi:hypothetical protein
MFGDEDESFAASGPEASVFAGGVSDANALAASATIPTKRPIPRIVKALFELEGLILILHNIERPKFSPMTAG